MADEIAFVERVIRDLRGRAWRERWEPIFDPAKETARAVFLQRDGVSGNLLNSTPLHLVWRHEVMG